MPQPDPLSSSSADCSIVRDSRRKSDIYSSDSSEDGNQLRNDDCRRVLPDPRKAARVGRVDFEFGVSLRMGRFTCSGNQGVQCSRTVSSPPTLRNEAIFPPVKASKMP